MYPALILLLPLIRTPRLPAVDCTIPSASLNGLVRFAERPNLVSARVPSRFKRALITSLSCNVLLQSSTDDYNPPPPQTNQPSTLLPAITLPETYHRIHSSLYKPCAKVTAFLVLVLILEGATDSLFRNVGKKLPLLAALITKKRAVLRRKEVNVTKQ